ncbi:MAG: carboxypeptidase regulatory-like domain-containing protein [Planctomycetota bacterium]|nr:MAG: carboxypeptidase regulatory-like domain-containing protein [Planctomycetota bacterium]
MSRRGSKQRLAFALIAAAALVLALWFIVRRGADPATPVHSASGESAAQARAPAQDAQVDEADESHGARASLAGADPSAEPSIVAVATATGPILAGRIVDEHGAAIAGAEVYARAWRLAGQFDERVYGAPLHGREPHATWSDAVRAVSGADGRFELRAAPVGAVQLAVRAPSFAPLDRPALGVPAHGREIGDVELARGLRLVGRVVDAHGDGVTDARLLARAVEDDFNRPIWLNAGAVDVDGRFDLDGLAAGHWELIVLSTAHPNTRANGVCDALECRDVEIKLSDGYTIRGRVKGAAQYGRPLVVRGSYLPPKGTKRDLETTRYVSAEVGADERFELRGLSGPDGQWSIRAQPVTPILETTTPLSRNTRVAPGAQDVLLELFPLARYRARPVDAISGLAVASTRAGVIWDDGLGAAAESLTAVDGVVEFDVRAPVDSKHVTVGLSADGYETWRVMLAYSSTHDVHDLGTAAMQPAAQRTLRTIDSVSRAPIPAAKVYLENLVRDQQRVPGEPVSVALTHYELATDASGEASVTRAIGARSRLSVDAEGYLALERELEAATAEDPRVLEIELVRGLPLTVLVLAGRERCVGMHVSVSSFGRRDGAGYSGGSTTDEQGIAHFDGLSPGSYRALVRAENESRYERATVEFEVTVARAHVEIALPPATVLEGAITLRGRPLPGALVRGMLNTRASRFPGNGDRIIADAGEARTDVHGRFRLDDVAPGKRRLLIEHPSLTTPARWSIELEPGHNEGTFEVGPAELRGRAVDDSGAPVSGCELELSFDAGTRRAEGFDQHRREPGRRATSSADGSFAFENLPPGMPFTIAPKESAFVAASTSLVLTAGELRTDWIVRLERAGQLHVTLARADGKTAFGELVVERDSERRSVRGMSNEARFQLAPGKWRVSLMPWDPDQTTALAGPFEASIVVGATTELAIEVPVPDAAR